MWQEKLFRTPDPLSAFRGGSGHKTTYNMADHMAKIRWLPNKMSDIIMQCTSKLTVPNRRICSPCVTHGKILSWSQWDIGRIYAKVRKSMNVMNIITTCRCTSKGELNIIFDFCINPSYVFRCLCSPHGKNLCKKNKNKFILMIELNWWRVLH